MLQDPFKTASGCRIQDSGTRGYRRWKPADFLHSTRCAPLESAGVKPYDGLGCSGRARCESPLANGACLFLDPPDG